MTDAINPTDPSNQQADYMKLFMQELTYQDPLKPVDNREFMAQMAQFSLLQEAHTTSEAVSPLAGMLSANQSLMLLDKNVRIQGLADEGVVTKISFRSGQPKLTITMHNGTIEEDRDLKEIEQVLSTGRY